MGKEEEEGGFKKGENLYSYRDFEVFPPFYFLEREGKRSNACYICPLRKPRPSGKLVCVCMVFFVFLHLAVGIPILPLRTIWTKAADKKQGGYNKKRSRSRN